ncbi:MAG: hypothetical protein ACI4QM_00125 [Alphaproteobacteria bacterium]
MSEEKEEKKETETEKTEEKTKTEEVKHTRSGIVTFMRRVLLIGGVGALSLFGLKKVADHIVKSNETAVELNSRTPEHSVMKNGKNTRVSEFAKNGAISGIYGRATNIDTLRETGDKLDKTAPETGALAGVNRVGEMMGDTLVKPQALVHTTNERSGALETRRLYETDSIVGVGKELKFRSEGGKVLLGKVVLDEQTAVRFSGTDAIMYMADSGLKIVGKDAARLDMTPTQDGGLSVKVKEAETVVGEKAQTTTKTPVTSKTVVEEKAAASKGKAKSASKTSSGRGATRIGGRNAARVISNTPSKARVLNTHRQGERIDMTGDATTTTVSVQFGEKTQTAQASKPVINPAAFRDSGGR